MRKDVFIFSWVGLRELSQLYCYISTFGRNDKSKHDFNIVFFFSVTSILFQNTLSVVAKALRVAIRRRRKSISQQICLFSEDLTIMRGILGRFGMFATKKKNS